MPTINTSRPHATITLPTQIQSPLLQLPGEIRNLIYTHVLGNLNIKILEADNIPDALYPPFRLHTTASNTQTLEQERPTYCTTLLRTCRQVHRETRLLFFSLNVFSAEHLVGLIWVEIVAAREQKAAITELRLVMRTPGDKLYLRCWKDMRSDPGRLSSRALQMWSEHGKRMTDTEVDFLPLLTDFVGLRRVVVRDEMTQLTMGLKRREVIRVGERSVEIVVE